MMLSQSILKPSCNDEIIFYTPVHKHLKVSFQTPVKPGHACLSNLNIHGPAKSPKSTSNKIMEQEEDLRWRERIEVVTKIDHDDYTNLAQEFIHDTIAKAVALASRQFCTPDEAADTVEPCVQHSVSTLLPALLATPQGTNSTDELPAQQCSDYTLPENNDREAFKDATEMLQQGFDFNLDFLENKGEGIATSELRKQSLYLRFDPLVTRDAAKPLSGRRWDIFDLNGSMGGPPVPEQPVLEGTTSSPVDLLCGSPSNRIPVMDDFVDLEGKSFKDEEIVQVLKYSDADLDHLQKPLLQKISSLESKVKSHEAEVRSQRDAIGQMQVVLEEFEGTVVEITGKHKEELQKKEESQEELKKENAKMLTHLESVEKAYLELLQRCEQMKEGIGNYKANEETYKKVIAEYQNSQESSRQRHDRLKATMEESLERLGAEHEMKEKELHSQNAGLKARCKFLENQNKSLQSQLDQKSKESQELAKICDELIVQQQTPQ